ELRDATLIWYVGLDSEATAIGNRLWNGEELDDQTAGRVAGLFRLIFSNETPVSHGPASEPVYLIMATTPERILRMKPQNLITGLPIKHLGWPVECWRCSAAEYSCRGGDGAP